MSAEPAALLRIPDRSQESVPHGWSEQWLAQVRETEDLRRLLDGASTLQGYIAAWKKKGYETAEFDGSLRYTEARIGQLLPAAHQGERTDLNFSARGEVDLPFQRHAEFRTMGAHFDLVIEAVRNGKRSRGAVLRYIDEQTAQGHTAAFAPMIRRGDFRTVLADVPAESVPLILTDPPYPAEYLPLWSDLAAFAARVLVPGGSLLAYSGQGNLPEVLDRIRAHLRYWWVLAVVHEYGSQNLPGKFVTIGWKPIVWFVKGGRRDTRYVVDQLDGSAPRRTMQDWAQGQQELLPLIRILTRPDELIIDPFAGSGTVGYAALTAGRRFLGAELRDDESWER